MQTLQTKQQMEQIKKARTRSLPWLAGSSDTEADVTEKENYLVTIKEKEHGNLFQKKLHNLTKVMKRTQKKLSDMQNSLSVSQTQLADASSIQERDGQLSCLQSCHEAMQKKKDMVTKQTI